jgi:S1-C subfamily serine protease
MTQLALLACAALFAAQDPKVIHPQDIVTALETALADAIETAEPSVVAISRLKSADGTTQVIRDPRKASRRATPMFPQQLDPNDPSFVSYDYGSGVVIGERCEILTAFHVVQGASRLTVQARNVAAFDAEILAADPRSDLAVIAPLTSLIPDLVEKLKPIQIGQAETLRKGAFLVALGNPYNAARHDGRASASWGILANVARQIQEPLSDAFNPAPQAFRHFPTLLQLDSKLNLGMSGGAVINLRGELVGLTTAAADAPGYDAQAGYAIPLDPLGRRVVERLKQGLEVEYGFIGIKLSTQMPNQVGAVTPGTPAEEAGLRERDVIIGVGDLPVEEVKGGLNLALALAPVGELTALRILRDGQPRDLKVRLSKYPVEGEVIATNRPDPWRGLRVDFSTMIAGSTFSDKILEALVKGGVGIVEVVSGSPADLAGLKKGQIITAVDGMKVRSPEEFLKAVAGRKDSVRLTTELGEVTVR